MIGTLVHDGFGRDISYLRISVTDKCNYRCVYCMPAQGVPSRAHDELLSAEEITRFVRIAAENGVRHVRLTGGEPLVSRRIIPLIEEIRATPGIDDIALTTNGALLPQMAADLKRAGLSRVNISLDTLDAEQFARITRLGRVEQALRGLDAALAHGFSPVKVNTVVVRSLDQDLFSLARLSVDRPVHVRFIEFMPIGDGDALGRDSSADAYDPAHWGLSDVVPSHELRERLSREGEAAGLGALVPAEGNSPEGSGPARYWRFEHAKGTVGFISALSDHFCARCNRLRLTADGTVRPCLFSDDEIQVREALRAGDDDAVRELFRKACAIKPQQHRITDGTTRFMSQIGG